MYAQKLHTKNIDLSAVIERESKSTLPFEDISVVVRQITASSELRDLNRFSNS